jgi:hypothetical protein
MKLYNEANELFGDMVDLTEEEYKEFAEYINSISEPVNGRTFWEILDEFVGRGVCSRNNSK